MADKEVILNGVTLVHGQGVKESVEGSSTTDTITCFDEVLTDGAFALSYKLDIDRLVFETQKQYIDLRNVLKKMMTTAGDITTREVIRYQSQRPFVIVKNYHGCVLESTSYEIKAEEKSAQNLSFVCSSMKEYTEAYTGE